MNIRIFLAIAVAVQVAVASAAKPKPLVLSYYDWRDATTNLVLEGCGFPQTTSPFVRLPRRARCPSAQ